MFQSRWIACQYSLKKKLGEEKKTSPSRLVGFSIASVGHFKLLYHLFVCEAKDNVRLAFSPAICGFQWKVFTDTGFDPFCLFLKKCTNMFFFLKRALENKSFVYEHCNKKAEACGWKNSGRVVNKGPDVI